MAATTLRHLTSSVHRLGTSDEHEEASSAPDHPVTGRDIF